MQVRTGRHEIGCGGLPVVAGAAPEVQLPGESQRRGIRGEVEAVEARTRPRGVPPQSTQGSAYPRVRGLARSAHVSSSLDLREEIRPGDARLGSGLFDSRDGLDQIEVGDERGVDQRVERGVAEVAPPLERRVCACGLRLQEGFGKSLYRLRQLGVGRERAAHRGQKGEGRVSSRLDRRPHSFFRLHTQLLRSAGAPWSYHGWIARQRTAVVTRYYSNTI